MQPEQWPSMNRLWSMSDLHINMKKYMLMTKLILSEAWSSVYQDAQIFKLTYIIHVLCNVLFLLCY
jgi:Iap family predicted aminopeptidase